MSDTKISDPAPNWCRTCGRRPNDPMAALCLDTHHRTLERLHPQPAELAEQQGVREQFEDWARTQFLVGRSGSISPSGQIAWRAWQAAIAYRHPVCGTCAEVIQPNSLTGTTCGCALAATGKQQVGEVQGGDVARVDFTPYGMVGKPDGYYVSFTDHQRALAARQPGELIAQKVGDYRVTVAENTITVSHGRDIVFAYSAGDAEPIMARQAGAQVPVAMVLSCKERRNSSIIDKAFPAGTTLYTAPPAQGIDLGQFRKLAMPVLCGTLCARDAESMCRRLHAALIDGQRDAAPGVGS